MENWTSSILDDNLDVDLLAYYIKQYIEIEKAKYNAYNLRYIYKYGGVIGDYDSVEDLMVVHELKNYHDAYIYTYYYISRHHPRYNKSQYLLDYNKPWHCDYYAGSEVTYNYIVNYISPRFNELIKRYESIRY